MGMGCDPKVRHFVTLINNEEQLAYGFGKCKAL